MEEKIKEKRQKYKIKKFKFPIDLIEFPIKYSNDLKVLKGKEKLGMIDIRAGDSRALPLGNESIDGIITSPP
ncbi:hypothetical protein ES703_20536 [subsurface metagenome]